MNKHNSTFLLTMLLALFTLGFAGDSRAQVAAVHNITQEEYASILRKEKAIVIDVRTPEEVAGGHIKGATVFADIRDPQFENIIGKLDKSKAYIVYCHSGGRSSSAANYMSEKGFTRVYNLKGGISNWKGEVSRQQWNN